jgi:hypothetical protein
MSLSNKFAVIISSNYPNTSSALNGCINDGINMIKFLNNKLKYLEENIKFLNDKLITEPNNKSTKTNIINSLEEFINKINLLNSACELWIIYSGHGTQVRDRNNDEVTDNYDEVIVPTDYNTSGFITDDVLYSILCKITNTNCKVMGFFDSCNSGTVLDLKHKYINGNVQSIENKNDELKCKVFMISGCKDSQTSADYFDHESNQFGGALTNAFLKQVIYKPNNEIKFITLINSIRKYLKKNRFTQIPQLTTNSNIDNNTFLYKQINGNYELFFKNTSNPPNNKLKRQRRRRRHQLRMRRLRLQSRLQSRLQKNAKKNKKMK